MLMGNILCEDIICTTFLFVKVHNFCPTKITRTVVRMLYHGSKVYVHCINIPTREFVISFIKCQDLSNTYRLMNHDISDITYHEIHANLPLLLYNIACGC